jgi:hypothetical protein
VISHEYLTNTDLQVVTCSDANCATSPTLVTAHVTANNVGSYASMVLNSAGFAVISQYDATSGDLVMMVCSDATCTTRTITSVDTANDVGQWTSIALDSSGFPVVSYYDVTAGKLKVMHCITVGCISTATIVTPDAASLVGQYTSLVLDSSGFPVISYWHQTNGA